MDIETGEGGVASLSHQLYGAGAGGAASRFFVRCVEFCFVSGATYQADDVGAYLRDIRDGYGFGEQGGCRGEPKGTVEQTGP